MQTSTKCKVFITFCLVFITQFAIFAQQKQDVIYRNYIDYESNSFSEDFAVIGNNAITYKGFENKAYNQSKSRKEIANDMAFIDVDNDTSTFQSSSADLNINLASLSCVKIKFAYLVWGSVYSNTAQGDPRVVKLKLPGSTTYEEITQTIESNNTTLNYSVHAADITAKVKALSNPNGTYTVANISAALDPTGLSSAPAAGWSIVFVYEDLSHTLPPKSILIERIFTSVDGSPEIQWNNFVNLPNHTLKNIKARVAVVSLGGDQKGAGQLTLNTKEMGTIGGKVNPTTNFFDGTITKNLTNNVTTRVPASTNTLGWDIDDFEVENTNNTIIPNPTDPNRTRLRFQRTDNTFNYMPLLGVISMDLDTPIFEVQKVVKMKDTSGNWVSAQNQKVKNGEEILYEVTVKNVGTSDFRGAKITLNIPQGASFSRYVDIPPTSIIRETNKTANKINIDFHQPFLAGSTYKISYIAKVNIDCTQLRSACGNKMVSQDVLEYTTTTGAVLKGQNGHVPAYIKSATGTQTCPKTPDETIFYVDDNLCVKQEFPFCGATTLTAGNGYVRYEWRTQGSNQVISANQTLNISQPGVYEVTRIPATGQNCFNSEKEIFNVYRRTTETKNPLEKYATKNVKCANDNSDYIEVYLCNASKEFNLDLTGINNSDIVWYKYRGTGRTGKETCPPSVISDVATDANWQQIGTGKDFTLTQAQVASTESGSEFALRINYQSCPTTNFFRAFKGSLTFSVEGQNIFCNDGKVIIKNIPTGKYQYQVLKSNQTPSDAAWININSTGGNNTAEVAVKDEAEYKVFIRPLLEGTAVAYQKNVCVYEKTVSILKITEAESLTITHKDVLCATENSGNGELRIIVANKVPKPYNIIVKQGTRIIAQYQDVEDSQTNTSVNNNLTSLVSGTYDIVLKSAGCTITKQETIAGVAPLIVSASAAKNYCGGTNFNTLRLNIKGGTLITANTGYNIQVTTDTNAATTITRNEKTAQVTAPSLETSYDIDFSYVNASYVNFKVIVTDGNGCKVTKSFQVRTAPKPDFTLAKVNASCSYNSGSITVNFVDPDFPKYNSIVKYHLYKLVNGSWTFVSTQNSAKFSSLEEGTYTVALQYGQRANSLCNYQNNAQETITASDPLIGFVGIKKLPCASPALPAVVRVNNVTGGSGAYEFDFGNGVWKTTDEESLSPGSYIIKIRDRNNHDCIYQQPITVPKALEIPEMTHNITYVCDGTPLLSVQPKNTTDYEYSYGTNNNFVTTPLTNETIAKTATTYKIYYRQKQSPTPNILIQEDFGRGANTCNSNVYHEYVCRKDYRSIADGEYLIKAANTGLGLNNGCWTTPSDHTGYPNGRYLAMNVGSTGYNKAIYHKTVNNVLPGQKIKFKMYVYNLCHCPTCAPPLFAVRIVNATTGAEIQTSSTIAPAVNGHNPNAWEEFIGELMAPGTNSIRIEIISRSAAHGGNDLALDDIYVYQEPEICDNTYKEITLNINQDKAFAISGTPEVKAVTCNGGNDGQVRITLKNVDEKNIRYRLYKGTTPSGNYTTTTQSIISITNLSAGNYTFEAIKETCTIKQSIIVTQPNEVRVTSNRTLSSYLNCGQTQKVVNLSSIITTTGGNGNYVYEVLGPGLPANTQADASGNITLPGIGTYTIKVKDTNGCQSTNAVVSYQLLARNPLQITLATNCNNGAITVSHNNANPGATYKYQYKLVSETVWRDNGTSSVITNLAAGSYDIKVTDNYDCSDTKQVQLGAPITANVKAIPHMVCNGVTQQGGVEISQLQGGFVTPTYEVSATNVGGNPTTYTAVAGTSITLNLAPGNYDIYIRDGATTARCAYKIQSNVQIKPNDNFAIQSVTPENPSCENDKGKIKISLTGEAPYKVKISNTANTYSREATYTNGTILIDEVPSDTYNVQVTSARNCVLNNATTVTLTSPQSMKGSISNETITACEANPKAKVKITSDTTNNIAGYTIQYSFDRGVTWTSSDTKEGLTDGQVIYAVIGRFLAPNLTTPVCSVELAPHIAKIVTASFDVQYANITNQTTCTYDLPVKLSTTTTYNAVEYSKDGGTTWITTGIGAAPSYDYTFAGLEKGRVYNLKVRVRETATSAWCEMPHTLDINKIPQSQVHSTEASSFTCAGQANGAISYTFNSTVTSWELLYADTMSQVPNTLGILPGVTGVATNQVNLTNVPAGKYLLKMVTTTCGANYTSPLEVVNRASETPFTVSTTTPTVNLSCHTATTIKVGIANGGARTFRVQMLKAKNASLRLNIGGSKGRISQGEIKLSLSDFVTPPTTAQTLVVTVTDEYGCQVDTNVTVNPTQLPTFTVAQESNCNVPYTVKIMPTAPTTTITDFRYSVDGGVTYRDTNILEVPAGFDQSLVRVLYKPTECVSAALTSQQIVYPAFKASITKAKEASCGTTPAQGVVSIQVASGSGSYEYSVVGQPAMQNIPFTSSATIPLAENATYTITVVDKKSTASCATITQQIAFDKAELPVFTAAHRNAVGCGATATGEIILTIPNAQNIQGPYDYKLYSAGAVYAATKSVKEENGNTIVTFTGLIPNTYEPEVTSNRGCSVRLTGASAVTIPALPSFDATMGTTLPKFNCLVVGQANDKAKLTVNVTGGVAPYTYILRNNIDNSILETNQDNATSYTFVLSDTGEDYEVKWEVKDANGCSPNITGATIVAIATREKITGATITQVNQMTCTTPEKVSLTIDRTKQSVNGFDIDIKNADGTTPAGVTTITGQPTGATLIDLPNVEGNYYFQITDKDTGCTFITSTHSVVKTASPTVSITANDVCHGSTEITFNVSIAGNVRDYSLDIISPTSVVVASATGNATNLNRPVIATGLTAGALNGEYKVKVKETNTNCTAESSVKVEQAANPITFTSRIVKQISLDCQGNSLNDGEIEVETLAAGGWGASYEYQLLYNGNIEVPYSSQTVFKELRAGTYVIQVKDKNGCEKNGNQHILSLPNPISVANVNITTTPNTCSVLGTVAVTGVTGGSQNYTYALYNASTNQLVMEGKEAVTPSTGNYTFNNVSGGTYYILITDPLLCSPAQTQTAVVAPPDIILPIATVTKYPDCTTNGEITIGIPTVGLAPFTYYQVDPNTNAVMATLTSNVFNNVPNAPTTTYKFKVVDANGCEGFTNRITIDAVQPINLTITNDENVSPHTITHLNCFGSRSGQIVVRATGGQVGTDYTYTLLDGTQTIIAGIAPNNNGVFSNLPEGRYYVRVTQGNTACDQDTTEIIIEQEKEFTAYGVATNVSCNGQNDGKYTITLKDRPNLLNGTARQYTYAISPDLGKFVDNGGIFTNLEPGTYTVIMQDQNGCRPTVYELDQNTGTISKKLDANGNDIHIFEFTIVEPQPLSVGVLTGTYQHESCVGAADGKVKLSINGGTPLEDTTTTPPTSYYQYYLDGDTTTALIYDKTRGLENLSSGSHSIRVVDKNLCEQVVSIDIEAGSDIQVTLDESEGYQCVDGDLKYIVKAVVTPTSESTNVTYRLYEASQYPPAVLGTGGQRNNSNRFELSVDENLDKDYIIEVTKEVVGHGACRQIQAIKVKAQKKVAVDGTPSAVKVNCYGGNDGKIVIDAKDGSGNYQFAISPNYEYKTPSANNNKRYEFTGLTEGFYHIKIKDLTYNCEIEVRDIKVEEYPRLVIEQVAKQNVTCYGKNDGSIEYVFGELDTATGTRKATGNPLYEFILYKHNSTGIDEIVRSGQNLNANDRMSFSSLAPAKYSLVVTDANKCSLTQDFEILEGVDLTAKVQQVYNCSDDLGSVQTPTYDLYVTVKTPYLGHRYSINDLQYSYDNDTTRRNFDLVINNDGSANDSGVETHDLFVIKNPQASGAPLSNGSHTITLYYKGGQCQGVSQTFTIDGYTALTITDHTQADSLNEIKVSISGGKENYMVYFSSPQYNTAAELKMYYSHKQEARANENITYYVQRTDADAINSSGEKVKQVRVYVEDAKGCGYYITLEKKFYDVQVPNFFTPNGDGNNDYWAPENLVSYPNAEVKIFDRYGRHIATLKATQQWDGRYGGTELPAGDYWYFLHLNDPEDNRIIKGHFTLYR